MFVLNAFDIVISKFECMKGRVFPVVPKWALRSSNLLHVSYDFIDDIVDERPVTDFNENDATKIVFQGFCNSASQDTLEFANNIGSQLSTILSHISINVILDCMKPESSVPNAA